MKLVNRATIAMAVAAGALVWTSTSRADGPVVIQQPAPQPAAQPVVVTNSAPSRGVVAESTPTYTGPNRGLLATGLVTFGISYGAGVIVAASSNHYGDSHLYVPIAGPWIDIADRGGCGPATSVSCDNETANKVGLAVDGVFQAVGAIAVVTSFLYPEEEHHVAGEVVGKTAPPKPEVHVAPTTGRNGTGLAVFGTF